MALTGTGTQVDPYLIYNEANLIEINNLTSNQVKNKHFKMMNDISVSSSLEVRSFSGIFDGSNYTLMATIKSCAPFSHYHVEDGTFKMVIKNLNVKYDSMVPGSFAHASPLVSSSSISLDIINCHVDVGSILADDVSFSSGLVANTNRSTTITNCTVTIPNISSSGNCGGLVGVAWGSIEITNCSVNADIKGGYRIGGFIGTNKKAVKINKCYYKGTLTTKNFAYGCIGFNECYNNTQIKDIIIDTQIKGMPDSNVQNPSIGYCMYIGNAVNNDLYNITNTSVVNGIFIGASKYPIVEYGYEGNSVLTVSGCYMDAFTTNDYEEYYDNLIWWRDDFKAFTSTRKMIKKDSYKGFDFINTWDIDEGVSYPYFKNNIETKIIPINRNPVPVIDVMFAKDTNGDYHESLRTYPVEYVDMYVLVNSGYSDFIGCKFKEVGGPDDTKPMIAPTEAANKMIKDKYNAVMGDPWSSAKENDTNIWMGHTFAYSDGLYCFRLTKNGTYEVEINYFDPTNPTIPIVKKKQIVMDYFDNIKPTVVFESLPTSTVNKFNLIFTAKDNNKLKKVTIRKKV